MKFKLDAPLLEQALNVISKIAAPESGNIAIKGDKRIRIFSSSQVNSVQVTLPVKPDGSNEFGISIEALRQAIKGRTSLTCSFKNTMLNIKSSSYEAELATVDAIREEGAEQKFNATVELDEEGMQTLRKLVQDVALKPNPVVSSFMPCGVKITKKQTFVACFDTTHMAFASSKDLKGEASFVLPLDIVMLITNVFVSGATLRISDSVVEVSNKLVTARLSIPTLDAELPSLEDVINQSKSIESTKGTQVTLSKSELISFLDNSRAVASRERSEIRANSSEGNLEFSVLTTSGQVKSKVKHKGKVKFVVDFEYFDEMIRKCSDEVELVVVDGAYIKVKTKNCYLVTGLNQDG